MRKSAPSTLAAAVATLTAGCAAGFDRISEPPKFTERSAAIDSASTGTALRSIHSEDAARDPTSGSLWRSGPESLFGDRRARKVGDIVTILVQIDDEAEIRNRSERSRSGSEALNVPSLFGVEALAQRVLPGGAGLDPAIELSSQSSSNGEGTIRREEKITLRVAATVIELLPNGHLVVNGSQEVRVNHELRDLQVVGVIRTEDITRSNVITYDKIADARISYGGRGQISNAQKPRYGQRIIDGVSPF